MTSDNRMPYRHDVARSAATACLRRARVNLSLSQVELAQRLGTTDRVVRRRESGRANLGVLESLLRDPAVARALAKEILRATADRRDLLSASPQNDNDEEAA